MYKVPVSKLIEVVVQAHAAVLEISQCHLESTSVLVIMNSKKINAVTTMALRHEAALRLNENFIL
jgi:hypothetical protein